MKKQLLKCLLITCLVLSVGGTSFAQTRIYVKARPTVTVTARPANPHKDYVWVDDEWTPRNGTYVRVAGHWSAPRRGYVWVPGHWTSEKRGDYWVPGHWRRV